MVLPPDFSKLTSQELERMTAAGNFKQMKTVIANLEGVLGECFTDCVFDMTTSTILKEEKNCLNKCHSKYMESLKRMSYRLGEEQTKLKFNLDRE